MNEPWTRRPVKRRQSCILEPMEEGVQVMRRGRDWRLGMRVIR